MGLFKKKKNIIPILAVTDGEIASLETLDDGVFSEKMLGDGVVIKLDKKQKFAKIYAPISGELVTAFPTGHAFGIKTDTGLEVLIHIGLDTVNLNGKGFKINVIQGQAVKEGDLLTTVNIQEIKDKVPEIDPIITMTSGQKIKNIAKGKVKTSDTIFEI